MYLLLRSFTMYIRLGSYHTARMLLQDMRKNTNIQMLDVVKSSYLAPEEVAAFHQVSRRICYTFMGLIQ